MKLLASFALVVVLIVASCSGPKNINFDKDPLLKIENPYWQKMFPGQEDGQKSMLLFLPYSVGLESYNVDSVYFRGYHNNLMRTSMGDTEVYRSMFMLEEDKTPIVPPYEIDEDQALVSYLNKEGVKLYFRVNNIIQGEPIYMP